MPPIVGMKPPTLLPMLLSKKCSLHVARVDRRYCAGVDF
jgi:hypothetical protein